MIVLVALTLLLLLTSCAPAAVTDQGRRVNGIYNLFLGAAAVIFLTVAGLIAWSMIRYRARPGDRELPDQFHTNVKLEVTWFAIPQLIVIGLFVATAFVLADVNEGPSEEGVVVHVQGFQWGWSFTYDETEVEITGLRRETPTLTLPTGEPVTFMLESRDVIHSFYVPKFLIKRDVVPGHPNHFTVTINEEGTFDGACAEFCGIFHDQMPFRIDAVSQAEFASWMDEQSRETGDDG